MKSYEKLKAIYEDNLSVDLLGEDLNTCVLENDANHIEAYMDHMNFDFLGVEEKGNVVGYIRREELANGKIKNYMRSFLAGDLISDSTPLIDLLEIFHQRDYIFVLEKNRVSKIVTLADLHKQPIRMLVFSFVSLLEMYLTELIEETYPDETWVEKLGVNRVLKAEAMMQQLQQKNEALTLLNSTQLVDKGEIVRNSPELLKQLGFMSKNKCKDFFKKVEYLRNNTAHAQKEIFYDNHELIQIMLELKRVLDSSVFTSEEE